MILLLITRILLVMRNYILLRLADVRKRPIVFYSLAHITRVRRQKSIPTKSLITHPQAFIQGSMTFRHDGFRKIENLLKNRH